MEIETRRLADLKPADYNPRKKLKPGDPEYEKIARSIEEFGYCDPIIINRDGTIIGGHQRTQVLLDMGAETADCVVVDLDPDKEKALNIALNKITGSWDEAKLADLIGSLDLEGYDLTKTGYSEPELKSILAQVTVTPDDFGQDFSLPNRQHVLAHTMNVTLHKQQIALIRGGACAGRKRGPRRNLREHRQERKRPQQGGAGMAQTEHKLVRERRPLTSIHPADYNPRKELKPGDPEFQNIQRSLKEFGYVDPIIINKDGTIIGGHQRASVLKSLGYTEADCIVVDLGKQDEKALNIALNKIGGQWDMSLLRDALQDLTLSPVDVNATGYSDDELSVILGDVMLEKQHEESPIDRMTFTFSLEQYADLQQALQIIGAKYKPDQMETFGNTNKTGNRIYMVVKEWVEQKKSKSG